MTPEEKIGPRLRDLRKSRGVTLEKLAEQSGLTKGYLSKIETGKKLPPIATLSRISAVLGSDIAYFFQNNEAWDSVDGRVSLVRAGQRRQAIRGGSSFGYDYESVAHKMQNKAMEPFVFTFPEQVDGDAYFNHDGEELVFILSGTVEFELAGKTLVLAPGDCLYFDSSQPHRGRSIGGDAKALVVIYQPQDDGVA